MADRTADQSASPSPTTTAFAATLAPSATNLTYRPDEIRRPQSSAHLPASAVIATRQPARDLGSEDTAIVYERVLHAQAAEPPAGAGESYEIVAPIGKGGMGEVFRAVQRSLGREVALKQLVSDNPAAVDYFLSEARVTARLAHANIIPVHALGRAGDGRPLIAMKLVHGPTWDELLHRDGPALDLAEHLRIFVSVCNAVAFAHDEGFLHRDLKPANVMVASYGQVFVLDWGLAVGLDRKLCDEHGILHVADVRSPAGTPAYMPPELALGDGRTQGAHTDVYLLGACLHEVATGAPPHAGDTTALVLEQAVASEPPTYAESVPRELAAICRRAMAKAPDDRYPSVTALRDAVTAFVTHSAARVVTEKGLRALARLREQTSAYRGLLALARPAEQTGAHNDPRAPLLHGEQTGASLTATESDKVEHTRAIHRTYSEARFAFELALESWPEAADASRGLGAAARVMLEHALEAEDLALSSRLASEVDDGELRARVEALKAKVAAREAELSALREQAKLLDSSVVAGPLGTVFIVAGVVGGLASIPTRMLFSRGVEAAVAPITALWACIAVGCGAYAYVVLRRAKKSLVSPRVAIPWAAVGAGCLLSGVVAKAQGEAPFRNASYSAMMIGIGFVAMAMQTRRWLMLPAIAAFIGALSLGFFPDQAVEIFGVLWFVTLTGVGIALRRGARFDSGETATATATE